MADRVAAWAARWSRAAAGAVVAGLGCAAVEAAWAAGGATGRRGPGIAAVAITDAGLVVPVAIAVGIAVAAIDGIVDPGQATPIRALLGRLRPDDRGRRAALAALCLVAAPTALAWATATAHMGRATMARVSDASRAGTAMAVGAIVLGLAASCAALAAERVARGWIERRGEADPVAFGVAGLALAAGALAYGVLGGTTGGEGAALGLGIWGVLRRPELDLRPAGLVAAMAAGAWAAPRLFARVWGPLAAAIALAPAVLVLRSARVMGAEPTVTVAIERGAPLGRIALARLRRATDRDRDGYSPWFGGGDCDDRNPDVSPMGFDIPGNGVDEDCSGEDLAPSPAVPATTGSAGAPPAPSASGSASAAGTGPALPDDLNVILLTIDTLRWQLGYMGYDKPVSPNLDRLAERSVVFEQAYALASYTGKSIGPMMCGKYPGETHRGWSHYNYFEPRDIMAAQRIQKAGVHTIAVQAHPYLVAGAGLQRGFDTVDRRALLTTFDPDGNDSVVTGDKLTDMAIDVLGKPEHTGRRFFAWVHYLDPHAEYMSHPGAPDFGKGMRARYDAEVWFSDREAGRLLDFVARQPWGARTAVVVTSDHGEAFGEHKMIRHGFELWEELVRVPLLLYVPGAPPRRIAARRSLVDLVPTLLDLLRVPPTTGTTPTDFLSGRSLGPDLVLGPGAAPEERDVYVDMPAGPNNDERQAFYHGDRKLVVSNRVRFQLFDLRADPGETEDLAGDKDALGAIVPAYRQFRARLREVYVKPLPKEEKTP